MSTKTSTTSTNTADLDQGVLNDLKGRINALGSKAKYLRACASEIREVITEQKVSADKVCAEANKALRKLRGKPVTPADIKAILDEADADPRSAENMFRSSFSGTPLKPADAHGSGTPNTTPPNAINAPSALFKREDLNTHVPYQASRAL